MSKVKTVCLVAAVLLFLFFSTIVRLSRNNQEDVLVVVGLDEFTSGGGGGGGGSASSPSTRRSAPSSSSSRDETGGGDLIVEQQQQRGEGHPQQENHPSENHNNNNHNKQKSGVRSSSGQQTKRRPSFAYSLNPPRWVDLPLDEARDTLLDAHLDAVKPILKRPSDDKGANTTTSSSSSRQFADDANRWRHPSEMPHPPSPAIKEAMIKTKRKPTPLPESCHVDRTLEPLPADFDAAEFCASIGTTPHEVPKKIYYGMMFNFEEHLLEVILHESYPLIEKYIIVESTTSHSQKKKPSLMLKRLMRDPRFAPFAEKVIPGEFTPKRTYKSGWDIERRQRSWIATLAGWGSNISTGDIFLGNMDLDEIYSRETLMRFKYCKEAPRWGPDYPLVMFNYRYHLNCYQDRILSTQTRVVFPWYPLAPTFNFYKARNSRRAFAFSDFLSEYENRRHMKVFHMSSFGSLADILKKQNHSPHRHVDSYEGKEKQLMKEIDRCFYNDEVRYFIDPLTEEMMPRFVWRNQCFYKHLGWIRYLRE